ncbi:MAG: lipid-binding SYLF domain-containing protein [Acidobacteria bacterium]|nr:lipid-binding SYLF domain-containing protein [Acidobacteriota bacterium]
MKRIFTLLAVLFLCPLAVSAGDDKSKVGDRLISSAAVLREIAGMPDTGIPQDLLDKSVCVVVIPSMKKGGFIFGGNYGKGAISCRTNMGDGPWSFPSMVLLGGGSFGLQIGGQAVDLVLLLMNLKGLESLLDSKFTLGGDASVAAGPVGRTAAAETDAWMSAQILAYSRARGLFAGLVIKGGVLRPDRDANFVLYGKAVRPRTLLIDGKTDSISPDAQIAKDLQTFVGELDRISPHKAN